jgi:hypothetical protein
MGADPEKIEKKKKKKKEKNHKNLWSQPSLSHDEYKSLHFG